MFWWLIENKRRCNVEVKVSVQFQKKVKNSVKEEIDKSVKSGPWFEATVLTETKISLQLNRPIELLC